ncbi:MAG: 3'(2'),5'-bisphosphate nucleotidase CysQ [Rikenellaceae bacterium]|nr:3'(2'),5'-bisphosphate nucleotidase CysQ [Rikenellaceae bacterium]
MIDNIQADFFFESAFNAALRAGTGIMEIYNGEQEFLVNLKSDNTPITEADKRSHETIKDYLSRTRIPLMSEEGRDLLYEERCSWDLYWLVDPLDGTLEFIKRTGEFTINIALMVNNRPAIGVVYVPLSGKIYFAIEGRGAWKRIGMTPNPNAQMNISEIMRGAEPLPQTDGANSPKVVALSRSHISPDTHVVVDSLKEKFGEVEILTQGSSLKLCLVAEGTVDIYPRTTPTSEWDTAAGECILAEAGGSIRELEHNSTLNYNKPSLINPNFICKSKFLQ